LLRKNVQGAKHERPERGVKSRERGRAGAEPCLKNHAPGELQVSERGGG